MANQELSNRNRPGRIGTALITWLAIALGANYLSGAAHAILGWTSDPTTPPPYVLLQIHGISAIALEILFGALIVAHVLPAWRARRHIASGLAVAIPFVVLMFSGLGLYYAGGETPREICRWSHIVIGLALPLPLLIHVAQRRR